MRGAMGHVTVLGTRHVMLRQECAQVDYVPRAMKDKRVIVSYRYSSQSLKHRFYTSGADLVSAYDIHLYLFLTLFSRDK